MTHTPGPWKFTAEKFRSADLIFADISANFKHDDPEQRFGDTIARVTTKFADGGRELPQEEWLANAHLIAAAPALLEALYAISIRAENDRLFWIADRAKLAIALATQEVQS